MNSFTLLEKNVLSDITQDKIKLMWELRVNQILGSERF